MSCGINHSIKNPDKLPIVPTNNNGADMTAPTNPLYHASLAIICVVSWRTPFEVVCAIIPLILVFVVHLWQVVWVGDKSLGNKSV